MGSSCPILKEPSHQIAVERAKHGKFCPAQPYCARGSAGTACPEDKFLVPDLGYSRLCRVVVPACQATQAGGPSRQPYAIVDYIPQSGTKNLPSTNKAWQYWQHWTQDFQMDYFFQNRKFYNAFRTLNANGNTKNLGIIHSWVSPNSSVIVVPLAKVLFRQVTENEETEAFIPLMHRENIGPHFHVEYNVVRKITERTVKLRCMAPLPDLSLNIELHSLQYSLLTPNYEQHRDPPGYKGKSHYFLL